MDLNELYFHHQVALMNGATGQMRIGSETCFDLASHYEKRIGEERARLGFIKKGWFDLPSSDRHIDQRGPGASPSILT